MRDKAAIRRNAVWVTYASNVSCEEDDGGGCARTLPDNVSGSEQEDALALRTENHQQQQTESKDEIKAVHRHHNEGEGKFQVGVSCQRETGAGVISLRRRNSRNLRRKQWRTKLRMK